LIIFEEAANEDMAYMFLEAAFPYNDATPILKHQKKGS
jgi:hypothetical protein